MSAPGKVLPHEETIQLIRLANSGDDAAFEKLVVHNYALVRSIVKKYTDKGVDYDDLFQTGCIGLVKAVRNYDESFNVRFSTYAVPMIAGEIKRMLRDEGMVKVSRSIKELAAQAMKIQEDLCAKNGKDATIDEIAKELHCSPYEIAEALEAMRPCVSIYEPVYDDSESGTAVADRISDGSNTEEAVINNIFLKEMLKSLPPKDRQIILLRYFKGLTQSQTAKIMGISQVQVSRLETKIISSLREKYKGA